MPISTEQQQRIDLLVGYDKSSYNKTQNALQDLFTKKLEAKVTLPEGALEKLAEKFLEASQLGGKELAGAFAKKFDTEVGNLLGDFAKLREDILEADAAGDVARMTTLKDEQALLEAKINASTEAHKQQVDAATKLKEAFQLRNATETGEKISTGFFDGLNKAKAGDLAGFSEALLGGVSKMAGSAGKAAGTQASTMEAGALATGLEGAATALGVTAAALAVVAVAVGVVVAGFALLDDAAKDLNKAMLEGASQADFAMQAQGSLITTMESSMESARTAALDMAWEFRGTGEEMTGILAQLNQAGFSYKEMEKDIRGSGNAQTAYAAAIKSTFIWSKALGLSTSEVADASAEWSTDFGLDLTQISENFSSISKFAMEGGFNVKRFFTAVSQATSGMAIYNTRMEEAAYLLSKTQKILGGTDASDFIKSLTQGFTDESMTDRIKRIMIAGQGDTQRIFSDTADRTAKGFAEAFGSSQTRGALESAFKSVDKKFDIGDPVALQKTWGDMDAKSRRLVVAELRANGDEQAQAAARQLETLGRLTDGATKGLDEQARGLGALDMQGKLAYKLQTLGDKRLNNMDVKELAAFESYAGVSGAQLEQLLRVESQLMADYELAKKNGTTTATSFNDFVSSNEEAQKQLEGIKDIEDSAEYYARKNVENTRSVFTQLKNGIAIILNDIYSILSDWFGWSKDKADPASAAKISEALEKLHAKTAESGERLSDLDEQLEAVDKTLSTAGDQSDEYVRAAAAKSDLEAAKRQEELVLALTKKQASAVSLMDPAVVKGAANADELIAEAAGQLMTTGKAMEVAAEKLTPEQLAEAQAKVAGVADVTKTVSRTVRRGHGDSDEVDSIVVDQSATAQAQADSLMGFATGDSTMSTKTAAALIATGTASEEMLRIERMAAAKDKTWQNSAYKTKSEEAHLDALKAYEGWRLATYAGFSGDELTQAMTEWATGETQSGSGILYEALAGKGFTHGPNAGLPSSPKNDSPWLLPEEPAVSPGGYNPLDVFGGQDPLWSPIPGNDFVMRPGQRAQRFNPSDTILGMKGGGPLVSGQSGGGGTVNITINGGDQSAVYQTVKAALKNSGMKGA